MLTLKIIQENKQEVIDRLRIKNFDATQIVESIQKKDDERKKTQKEQDDILEQINSISREVGDLFKSGKTTEANQAKEKSISLKDDVKKLSDRLAEIETELQNLLVLMPNLPHASVPVGKGADDNVKVKEGGVIPTLYSGAWG